MATQPQVTAGGSRQLMLVAGLAGLLLLLVGLLVVRPLLSGTGEGQATVTFAATVPLSSAAYSGRYQPAGTVTP